MAKRSAARPLPSGWRRLLTSTFGLKTLREGQRAVIERVVAREHTLAIMPTGAGKSLCYQLAALLMGGRAVVVSPLIALMKDQCDKLCGLGLVAVQVHSAMTAEARDLALDSLRDGSAQFVFTTPERLADPEFLAILKGQATALLVVDEAHCIAQWGHDFRPAFLDLGTARAQLGRPTVLALTATASPDTVQDICGLLGVPRSGVYSTGSWRENLHYRVEHVGDEAGKLARLIACVQASAGHGLVYTATVKAAEEVCRALEVAGESVGRYHGRLRAADRHAVQEAFMSGAVRVVVATNAFGLGIDKPDTRFVVHYQMPGSLDAYYQESGRAGRDGDTADCTLLYLRGDQAVQQFFMAGRYPAATELEAIYQGLHHPPDGEGGWTVEGLAAHVKRPLSKVKAVVSLLKNGKALSADAAGRLALLRPGLVAGELAQLQALYVRKREQGRDTLERMVAYALSGRCRWRVLLEHFGEESTFEQCGHCDNCVRLAAFEGPAADETEGRTTVAKPVAVFEPGQSVRVRRYGVGTVVSADAGSVTVAFSEGASRSFLPEYVKPARVRRVPTAA